MLNGEDSLRYPFCFVAHGYEFTCMCLSFHVTELKDHRNSFKSYTNQCEQLHHYIYLHTLMIYYLIIMANFTHTQLYIHVIYNHSDLVNASLMCLICNTLSLILFPV